MSPIELRPLEDADASAVFDMMRDPDAVARAAFTASDPDDRAAFDAWWARLRADEATTAWAVTADGAFAGTAAAFTRDGQREVTYWVDRSSWGRGVATAALRQLVSREPERPLYARVAADNAASVAVLERLGFTELSRETSFAPGRGRDVEERVYVLPPTLE